MRRANPAMRSWISTASSCKSRMRSEAAIRPSTAAGVEDEVAELSQNGYGQHRLTNGAQTAKNESWLHRKKQPGKPNLRPKVSHFAVPNNSGWTRGTTAGQTTHVHPLRLASDHLPPAKRKRVYHGELHMAHFFLTTLRAFIRCPWNMVVSSSWRLR